MINDFFRLLVLSHQTVQNNKDIKFTIINDKKEHQSWTQQIFGIFTW